MLATPAEARHRRDAYCCPPNIEVSVSAGALTCPGEEFVVSGTGFSGHGPVRIFFGDVLVATVPQDPAGNFETVITAPAAPPGSHILAVRDSGVDVTATVTCVATGQVGAVAFTGVVLRTWMVLLAALLLAGTGALVAARRRGRGSTEAA